MSAIQSSKHWKVLKNKSTTAIPGPDWQFLYESESFDLAKQRIIEEYKTTGLDKLMLVRPIDLYTVIYPIT